MGWPAQVILPLGRSIRRQSSSQEQYILPHRLEKAEPICGHFRTRNGASMERRTAVPVLQLSGINVLLFVEMLLIKVAVHLRGRIRQEIYKLCAFIYQSQGRQQAD